MKSFYQTRPYTSSNRKISSAETSILPGSCLANTVESGEGVVKRTVGTSADVFSGFAMDGQGVQTWLIRTEVKKVPATGPYTITLAKTPTADAAVSVVDAALALMTQHATTPADNVYTISGTLLTFHSADANVTVTITYKYAVTVAEWMAAYGTRYPGRTPADVTGNVAVLHTGFIYTDQIDTAVNWLSASVTDLKTAANGLVTRGGSGVAVPGEVIKAPTAESPVLGLFIR